MRNLFHYTKIDHMPDSNESAEAFLRRDSDSGESTDTKEITPKREDKLGQNVSMYLFIQVILLFCNIVFCGTNLYLSTKTWCPYGINGPNLVTTPMEEAMAYTVRDLKDNSTYDAEGRRVPDSGHLMFNEPGPEADKAWSDIVKYNNIRISPDEIPEDYRGKSGLVEFNDGSGDIYANVAVYHSIHCIKRIHHLLHFNHYHPGRTEEQKIALQQHGQHCLQYVLDAVRCNADLTVFPMQWGVRQRAPFGIDQGRHQCKDWNRIEEWMKSRTVDIYQPGLLMHPEFGWAYAEGAENITGVAHDTLISAQEH